MVIDLDGLSAEEVRRKYPEVYQWIYTRVKPERDQNNEEYRRLNWWLFARKNTELRSALAGLSRYIATGHVAKHRFFVFLNGEILPDDKLIAIASANAYHLGVLSSRIHVCWALAAGGRMGVGNDPVYSKTTCFDPFPFPDATPEQQARIRGLGEKLDKHRKARQKRHPDLTMTDMYNVHEALRAGRKLTAKEKAIHDGGLVTILRQLHDELDAAVADAYGWPANLPDEKILVRLVKLNAKRAEEEEAGTIRYLRPAYQDRKERKAVQTALELDEQSAKGKKAVKAPLKKAIWPSSLPEQTLAVRDQAYVFRKAGIAYTVETVAKQFIGANRAKVGEILETLETLGFT